MKQNTKDHLFSAVAGSALVLTIATGFFAILAISSIGGFASAIVASFVGAVIITSAADVSFSIACKAEEIRKGSCRVGMLATIAAGMGLFLAANMLADAPSSIQEPVENTKGISFLNHENTFNTSAQNGKKTLLLTANDFSPAPVTAQKLMAA